jgi:sugar transferase (PEP-CTERM/EpsH1 system associated)
VVNLINRLPEQRFRHCIISLTDVTAFRQRIRRQDVSVLALNKRPGKDPALYVRLWKAFRQLRPSIVHTRNLATLEAQLPAALAGVPGRIHGEHGWDVDDLEARSRKNVLIRRAVRPFVQEYVALSQQIAAYLRDQVRVPRGRMHQIYNGVDTARFRPERDREWVVERFGTDDVYVIGAVGRLQAVKDQTMLVRAFVELLQRRPELRNRARLVIVGDGALRSEIDELIRETGFADLCWLSGIQDDVPRFMRGFDLFVLPSLAEGVSNTILEAMATGLPVIATSVGGNPELVADGKTGTLVPAGTVDPMASAMSRYLADPALGLRQGREGRRVVENRFGLDEMVRQYQSLYDGIVARHVGGSGMDRASESSS